MDVVLPAPLTPATMITVGLNSPIDKPFCSGVSNSVMDSISNCLTAAGSVVWVSLTRRLRSCNKCSVALTPESAINRAVSSSS